MHMPRQQRRENECRESPDSVEKVNVGAANG